MNIARTVNAAELSFVLDTTVLIHVFRMRCIDHVPGLNLRFESPRVVVGEYAQREHRRSSVARTFPWLKVVGDPTSFFPMAEGLGPGERAAITLCASDRDHRVFVSDDLKAKREAVRLGISSVDSTALFAMIYCKGLTGQIEFIAHLRHVLSIRPAQAGS